jgi:hypothetical protein
MDRSFRELLLVDDVDAARHLVMADAAVLVTDD